MELPITDSKLLNNLPNRKGRISLRIGSALIATLFLVLMFYAWAHFREIEYAISHESGGPITAEQVDRAHRLTELAFVFLRYLFAALVGFVLAGGFATLSRNYEDEKQQRQKVATLEQKIEEAPDKIKPVWELARFTLESYFKRNLKQVRAIFYVSITVMAAGFVVILWGIREAVSDPSRLNIGIVASASGILTEFISLTFMAIYRSTMAQANEYVSVLERINTVGMAVQVLDSIADSSSELKDLTRIDIIRLLLSSSPSQIALSAPSQKQNAKEA